MLFNTILAGLSGAALVISSPLNARDSQHGVRPHVNVGPQRPWFPIALSPPRTRTCVVPSHNNLVIDDTPAILSAMHECNNGGRVLFPPGVTYIIGTAMNLTFLRSIDIDLQGTWLFTNDTTYWQENGFYQTYQNVTTFFQLGGYDVNFYGGGTLDGNGQVWYDLYAEDEYILRPVLFGTIGLHDATISNLNLRYSPEYYNFVANSTSVIFSDISIFGESVSSNEAKNTDGWDLYRASNVVIQNSVVYNQDDCVSFKPNSTSILVQNLECTGSHGISVGSLGQYVGQYDLVQDVLVYNITLTNVSDGARIKVWPGSPAELSGDLQGGGGTGLVKNIVYDTLTVNNADYSIEVTQCYGQTNLTLCNEYPSQLQIEDILIRNVQGTSSTKYKGISGYVECSSTSACQDISLQDIHVVAPNGSVNLFTCGDVNEGLLMGIDCTTVNYGYN